MCVCSGDLELKKTLKLNQNQRKTYVRLKQDSHVRIRAEDLTVLRLTEHPRRTTTVLLKKNDYYSFYIIIIIY